MDDDRDPESLRPPRARRSGSDKRRAQDRITFRVLPMERAKIAADADAAGRTLGSYIRACLLAAPLTPARRRAPADVKELARVLAELKRHGNNLNQLARYVNMANLPEAGELRALLQRHDRLIAAVLEALGRGPVAESAA